jgi:hypothetical protein
MAATAGARTLDLVRGLGADDAMNYPWGASPFPSEAKHEDMPNFERHDGGFYPPFTQDRQESKNRAEGPIWRSW